MGYCHIHGKYDGDGCSDCRDAEEQAASDREEMLRELDELRESQNELAYATNNPGDYHCPHCRLRSLKRSASRCPKCHGGIDSQYWENVKRVEEEARRAQEEVQRVKEEEWRRGEPERRQNQIREAEAKAEKERAASRRRFITIYFGYLLPTLALLIPMLSDLSNVKDLDTLFTVVCLFIPILNWVMLLGVLYKVFSMANPPDSSLLVLLLAIVVLTAVGFIWLSLINKKAKQ